jgi:hypothetical protein
MRELRYTLACDGSSDRALHPILDWLLRQHLAPDCALQSGLWHDTDLVARIREAVRLFPCDLLFVHRDAERESVAKRTEEIEEAKEKALAALPTDAALPAICVVPVRMTEAWLLFNEQAIRDAAGNSNGKIVLQMVGIHRAEDHPDPKETLEKLLRTASGLKGRRLDKFDERRARQRVAEFIDDFEPLRSLPAFRKLETDIKRIVAERAWNE